MSSDISNEYWTDFDFYEEIDDKYKKKMEILVEQRREENNSKKEKNEEQSLKDLLKGDNKVSNNNDLIFRKDSINLRRNISVDNLNHKKKEVSTNNLNNNRFNDENMGYWGAISI